MSKYERNVKEDEIGEKRGGVMEKEVEEKNRKEVKKLVLKCIELSRVKCRERERRVMKLREKVNEFVEG